MYGFFPHFLSEMFEKALNAGFIQATDYVEIWQAYLDYLRRRVDFTQGTYDTCVNKCLICLLCISLVLLKNVTAFW